LLVIAGVCALAGCAIFRDHTFANTERLDNSALPTRATDQLGDDDLKNGVFIGVAMSGGGSRAANFSAAVLLELESLGLLDEVSVVSAISGSTLTAAYYTLHHRDGVTDRNGWNEDQLKKRLGRDMLDMWFDRWLLPQNIARYWTSDFDRSDIMKGVFNEVLFDGRLLRFNELGAGTPKILIGATRLAGENFLFTDEKLADLKSQMTDLPVSTAIMASAAFPGAFQNVTLRNFAGRDDQDYVHLFDGGPSDNLGVAALFEVINKLDRTRDRPNPGLNGCVLILIDSFVDDAIEGEKKQGRRPDPRKFLDFVVDDNVGDAFNALLGNRRIDALRRMGYTESRIGKESFWSFKPLQDVADSANRDLECRVWHITFQHLPELAAADADEVGNVVNQIKTSFRLEGPKQDRFYRDGGYDQDAHAKELQDKLFQAARLLVREDPKALNGTRQYLRQVLVSPRRVGQRSAHEAPETGNGNHCGCAGNQKRDLKTVEAPKTAQ
jgi:predicted acylesterase/phospholipase RssA